MIHDTQNQEIEMVPQERINITLQQEKTRQESFIKLVTEYADRLEDDSLKDKLRGLVDYILSIKDMKATTMAECESLYNREISREMAQPYLRDMEIIRSLRMYFPQNIQVNGLWYREMSRYQHTIIEMLKRIVDAPDLLRVHLRESETLSPTSTVMNAVFVNTPRKSYSEDTMRIFSKLLQEFEQSMREYESTQNPREQHEARVTYDAIRRLYRETDDDRIPKLFREFTGTELVI